MAQRDPAPVWFQTRVSRILILYLCAVHSAAGVALWLAVLPVWATAAGVAAILLSAIDGLRIHGSRRGRRAVRALHWQADGTWRVLDGAGGAGRYDAQQVILAHPWLILVRLTGPTGPRFVLLASDSADREALRRLRVRLRRVAGRDGTSQEWPLAGT